MIETIRQGLKDDGFGVSVSKLCRWLGIARRTVYYKPVKSAPKVNPAFVESIKTMIKEHSSFGYPTVASLPRFNKNTVQRFSQPKGWQVRKRVIASRLRIQALPSVAAAPNERWSTDRCRIWSGRDDWVTLVLVIGCHTRELLGWHLSRSGKASTAGNSLKHARIARFGTFWRVPISFSVRSDNHRQWTGFYQSRLHFPSTQLRPSPGVHHAALHTTKRHDRIRLSYT